MHPRQTVPFDFRFIVQHDWNQAASATGHHLVYTLDRIKQYGNCHGGGDIGTAEREFFSDDPRRVLKKKLLSRYFTTLQSN